PAAAPGASADANVSNSTGGINGVMIDLAKLPASAALTPDDFTFRSGAGDSATGWANGPVPSSVTIRRGEGVGGSDRVTLVWPDSGRNAALKNAWLQVTVKADANTGLSRPDVFYFGNLVGEIATSLRFSSDPRRVDDEDLRNARSVLGRRNPVLFSIY